MWEIRNVKNTGNTGILAVKTGLYKYKYNYETIKNFRKKSVRKCTDKCYGILEKRVL